MGRVMASTASQSPLTIDLYLLAPVIIQFRQRYPDAIFDLRLNDQILSPAEDSLDLAVRIGNLPDSALLSRRLALYQLCC